MSKEKLTITDKINIFLTPLTIIVGLATIATCILAFVSFVIPQTTQPHSTPSPVVIIAPVSSSPTHLQDSPTYTPYPTYTPLPTLTPPPLPTQTSFTRIPLPFQDDFDNGIKPEWEMVSGTWRVINGQLAADETDQQTAILVGDNTWTDYTVDVDVYNYNFNSSAGVIVRENGGNFLLFKTSSTRSEWILVSGTSETVLAYSPEGGLSFSSFVGYVKNHFKIVVSNQTYSAYIDGKLYLQVSDPTLASGRTGILTQYLSREVHKFDDFSVTAP